MTDKEYTDPECVTRMVEYQNQINKLKSNAIEEAKESMACSNEELADLIDDTADILEVRGMAKNSFLKSDGSACLTQAISFTETNSVEQRQIRRHLGEQPEVVALWPYWNEEDRLRVSYTNRLVQFNDCREQTQQSMLDFLRKVSKRLRMENSIEV